MCELDFHVGNVPTFDDNNSIARVLTKPSNIGKRQGDSHIRCDQVHEGQSECRTALPGH